jgi:hypothetical protein
MILCRCARLGKIKTMEMKTVLWKWKILSLILLCTGLVLSFKLLLTNWSLRLAKSDLWVKNQDLAKRDAQIDIRDGNLRVYEIELTQAKTNFHRRAEFSGEKDGPFEVWTEIFSTNVDEELLDSRSNYFHAYNRSIYELYQLREKYGSLRVPPTTNDPKGHPRVPWRPPWTDAQTNTYTLIVELRISKSAKIDPLTRTYQFGSRVSWTNGDWLPRKPIREEDGFKIFKYSFYSIAPHTRYEFVVEPGFHPAPIFRLLIAELPKTNEWTDWKPPDCIELTNATAAYQRDLDSDCSSTVSASNHYELRYKTKAEYSGPHKKESPVNHIWLTFLEAAKLSLLLWAVFIGGWVFIYWMDQPIGWGRKQIKRIFRDIVSGNFPRIFAALSPSGVCSSCGHRFNRSSLFWRFKPFSNRFCPNCHEVLKKNRKWSYFFSFLSAIPVGVLFWMALDDSVGWIPVALATIVCFSIGYIITPYVTKFEPGYTGGDHATSIKSKEP